MSKDDVMRRLGAARPAAVPSQEPDALFARLVAGPGDARLAQGGSRRERFLTILRRPHVAAGSSLGVVGAVAAATLTLGGAASPVALAVTQASDGTVLVTVNTSNPNPATPWVVAANARLAQMGIDESINIGYESGPATVPGPVACQSDPFAAAPNGPRIEVDFDNNGTGVIPAGDTGAGTVHLAYCYYFTTPTEVGNSGPGSS